MICKFVGRIFFSINLLPVVHPSWATELEREVEEEVDSYILNPNYNPDKEYIPRADRPEWAAVGMLGVLVARDDGTCQVNGNCKVSDGGIATASDTGWRVTERVSDHLVKIVFR